jgi:hypothetical protein
MSAAVASAGVFSLVTVTVSSLPVPGPVP